MLNRRLVWLYQLCSPTIILYNISHVFRINFPLREKHTQEPGVFYEQTTKRSYAELCSE